MERETPPRLRRKRRQLRVKGHRLEGFTDPDGRVDPTRHQGPWLVHCQCGWTRLVDRQAGGSGQHYFHRQEMAGMNPTSLDRELEQEDEHG